MLIIEQTENDKLDLLRYAIEGGFEIGFRYRGKEFIEKRKRGERALTGIRFVKPANLGKREGTNEWTLRAYQTMGTTNSTTTRYATGNTKGGKPHWKTFLVNEIEGIVVYDGKGETGYKAFNDFSDANIPYKQGSDAHLAAIDKYFITGKPVSPPQGDDTDKFTSKGDKITNKVAKGYDKITPNPEAKPTVPRPEPKPEPKVPKPEPKPEPEMGGEPEMKNEPEMEPDFEDNIDDKPIRESSGFLKWVLNII